MGLPGSSPPLPGLPHPSTTNIADHSLRWGHAGDCRVWSMTSGPHPPEMEKRSRQVTPVPPDLEPGQEICSARPPQLQLPS